MYIGFDEFLTTVEDIPDTSETVTTTISEDIDPNLPSTSLEAL